MANRVCKVDKATNERLAQDAIAKGETRFISVTPCDKGHLMRYTSNHRCVDCKLESQRKAVANQSAEAKAKQREHARKYHNKRYHNDAAFKEKVTLSIKRRRLHSYVIKHADRLLDALSELEKLNG